ncbi:unnamed protein product [Bemisia tabaci]|uniref:Regulatory protein zeste n=1 Tax=Bemisia tabaci TaxID=7038 RepID=A0A9P0A001_BEMTA|nr:unnamed protein product [Bemisia tabaci]
MAAVSQQRQRIDDRQKAVLIDYMTEHSYFAKHGIGPGPQGKELGDRMWSTLATRLNACGKAQKNVSGWKQSWAGSVFQTEQHKIMSPARTRCRKRKKEVKTRLRPKSSLSGAVRASNNNNWTKRRTKHVPRKMCSAQPAGGRLLDVYYKIRKDLIRSQTITSKRKRKSHSVEGHRLWGHERRSWRHRVEQHIHVAVIALKRRPLRGVNRRAAANLSSTS